jgi:hypothetical protein
VDKIFKKNLPYNSSDLDALAQPLKLKESLEIRDGLGVHDVRPVRWLQFKATRFTIPDLGYFWFSKN